MNNGTMDGTSLRLSATLLLVGQLLYIVVTRLHPGRAAANNHPAVFAEYAGSGIWTALHLGQFAASLRTSGPSPAETSHRVCGVRNGNVDPWNLARALRGATI